MTRRIDASFGVQTAYTLRSVWGDLVKRKFGTLLTILVIAVSLTIPTVSYLLWKNLHWIFWMSLIPMATEWMGLNPYKSLPALFYGIILFMCAVSYNIVQAEVIKINGKDSQIFRNIGNDLKGKLSIIAYAAAIIFAFYFPVISYLIYIAIALTWIVPDSRLEKA